jgi:hypothetical protein
MNKHKLSIEEIKNKQLARNSEAFRIIQPIRGNPIWSKCMIDLPMPSIRGIVHQTMFRFIALVAYLQQLSPPGDHILVRARRTFPLVLAMIAMCSYVRRKCFNLAWRNSEEGFGETQIL